jgi:hypothetical protein
MSENSDAVQGWQEKVNPPPYQKKITKILYSSRAYPCDSALPLDVQAANTHRQVFRPFPLCSAGRCIIRQDVIVLRPAKTNIVWAVSPDRVVGTVHWIETMCPFSRNCVKNSNSTVLFKIFVYYHCLYMYHNTVAQGNILSNIANRSVELCCCDLRKFIFDNFAKMLIEVSFHL